MLTPSDKSKIQNFDKLKENHKRVFKHRLKKKCILAVEDIKYLLLNYEELSLKPRGFININSVIDIIELYEKVSLLQNM